MDKFDDVEQEELLEREDFKQELPKQIKIKSILNTCLIIITCGCCSFN